MIRSSLLAIVVLSLLLGVASHAQAGSMEGVWQLESGRWAGADGDTVFPGNPDLDKGSTAYRVFTRNHHFFISSAPAMDVFNANMTRYSVEGNALKMEKVVSKSPKHLDHWEWTFQLEEGKLILEMEGMREVWTRVE
jgi:hypothetical protein